MAKKFLVDIDVEGSVYQNNAISALLKADADGKLVAAIAGVDYAEAGSTGGGGATLSHDVMATESISKGQAVYVSGANGTNMLVSKASNSSEATSSKTLGLIDRSTIANDSAKVITEGLLDGLNTSMANAGDPVWLGTDGNLIYGLANKPTAPAHLVYLGVVTRVQSNNGEIFVHVQNGFETDELHDVIAAGRTSGNVMYWDGSINRYASIDSILGYTPYNSTNPNGYISGITGAMVTNALGYTPYNSTNPSGYITSSSLIWANISDKPSTLGGYGITDAASLYHNHNGTYWPVEGSWKPASLASSTRLIGKTSPDGGEFGLAYSGGQIHAYTDGFFYQNEGQYRVIDSSSISSQSVNYASSAGSVAWSNVSGRPTAVSSFSNDSGYQTSSGRVNGALRLWAESHPNDYYIVNNWTGSHWHLTSNHGSPVRVGYSDVAGNANQANGYTFNQSLQTTSSPTFQEVYANGWFRATGYQGLYNPTNGAHFYANSASYGAWRIEGSRNGWNGIHFGGGTGMTLMMNETEFGFHREGHGWYSRFTNGRYYGTSDAANYVHWDNVGSKAGNLTYWNSWYGSAYLGSDGNLYMGWLGRWTSETFNQDLRTSASPTFANVYNTGWFRAYGDSGLYQQDYGGHIARNSQSSYGTWTIWGYNKGGYAGMNIQDPQGYWNNYMHESGSGGLYSQNYRGDWVWYHNAGQNCTSFNGSTTDGGVRFRVNGSMRVTSDFNPQGYTGFGGNVEWANGSTQYHGSNYGYNWRDWGGWGGYWWNRNGGDMIMNLYALYSVTGSISDIRFKKDVEALPYGLKEIMQLNPIKYHYNLPKESMLSNDPDFFLGFSAQEVQGLIPEAVHEKINEDVPSLKGMLAITYDELIPVCVQAIKDQQVIIHNQNVRIAKLEELVNQLINK